MLIDYDTCLSHGLEMYNGPMFIRNFHVWKLAHLASRIIPITENFQLPYNSVIHVLDNVQYPNTEIQDVPRIEMNPFITHEKYRKWIYHSTDFRFSTDKVQCPIDIDYNSGMVSDTPTQRKYIFKTAKLQQNLMGFRNQYKSAFRYLYSLDMIPNMKESLVVINHNPLFRVFVFGKLRFFRKMQFILASILNTACALPTVRTQYIHIPLTTTVFPKESFRKTMKDLSLVSLKYPNNYHYLLMMQFLNYVNPLATTSMLDKIPEVYQKKIVLLFTVGNHALFYPLADLKALNTNNKAYIRIVNQLNMLAMSHTEEVQKVIAAIPDEDADTGETPTEQHDTPEKSATIKDILHTAKTANTVVKAIKDNESTTDTSELDHALNTTIDIDHEKEVLQKERAARSTPDIADEDPTSLEESEEYVEETPEEMDPSLLEDEDDELALDTQELIDILVEHDKQYQAQKRQKQVSIGVVQAKQRTDRQSKKTETDIDTDDISTAVIDDINHMTTNSPCIKSTTETVEEATDRSTRYIEELDAQAMQLIDNLEDLTPAQKERYKRLAVAYKNIVIGQKTVGEWLSAPPNTSLKDIELDFLKEEIPDQSMLKSSVLSLDDTYMQETFGRDLLAVATSFTKNGMFLINVKIEPVTTELNKLVKYTFQYEDVNGKSSSVQITLPQVNKHGHMFINGTKKILKKQMVNLPIIKVSNTRVSLASAMNKTIVERNTAKAHSFTAYISSLLKKLAAQDGITVDYVSSLIKINQPIAYEYTSLARLYRQIVITNKSRKLVFYYNYHTRLEYFTGNNKALREKVVNFEKKYKCVLCCKDGPHLGFIDINNTINFMDTMGVVLNQKRTNTLGLLFDISDKKLTSTTLSEWTTLKIRDKNLPIIFVLAYQYGLISTLNYIKCHWLRIGKQDKRVIQDNNPKREKPPIPGMKWAEEAYTPLQPGDKYIVKYDDILIPFQNEYLVINRYPLIQSLIASGLLLFDTSMFNFSDMENTSTYFTMLEMKGYSTNMLKAITGFFGYFIDPMTRDKLEMMHEPTNVRDLLIRSTQLLATEDHRQPSSMANHCVRGYERFNTIIFNEMSRALEEYQISGGAGSKFTLNPQSVFQRILTDQCIANIEELNPTMDVKEQTTVSYTGVGGRTAQSFVMEDRQYPEDGTGILSENTVDSGKVGIVAQMSVDPSIVNTRGIFEKKDSSELEPTQALAISSVLMPGVSNDDQLHQCVVTLSFQ